MIVTEEESVGADLQKAARTSMYDRPALDEGKKSGDEIMRGAVCGSKPDDAIARPDVGVARSMKGNEESVAKDPIFGAEIGETER